jgi:ATP adenylyltransferase
MDVFTTDVTHTMHNCRFCGIPDGITSFGVSDKPFCEDENFFAVASIGALVDGWSLIIPKKHVVSLREIYGTPEFKKFSADVVGKIRLNYGNVVLFEHGPSREGSLTSCGTDHAHLHVVPLPFSLNKDLVESGLNWQTIKSSDIAKTVHESEYLFFSDNPDDSDFHGSLHILQEPVSQYFRKIIARRLGKLDVSDYRQFLHLSTSESTQSRLALTES